MAFTWICLKKRAEFKVITLFPTTFCAFHLKHKYELKHLIYIKHRLYELLKRNCIQNKKKMLSFILLTASRIVYLFICICYNKYTHGRSNTTAQAIWEMFLNRKLFLNRIISTVSICCYLLLTTTKKCLRWQTTSLHSF